MAEFISHMMHSCQTMIFRGTPKARCSIGEHVHVADSGAWEQLLSLDVPVANSWTLQALIETWGNQAHIHAGVCTSMACYQTQQISNDCQWSYQGSDFNELGSHTQRAALS